MFRLILASLLSLTILTPDSDGMGGRRRAAFSSCNSVALAAAPCYADPIQLAQVQYTQLQTYFVPTTQVQFEYVQPTIQVELPPPAVTFSYQQPTVQLQTAPTYAPPVQLQAAPTYSAPRLQLQQSYAPAVQLRQRVQLQNVYAAPPVQLRGRVSASAYVAAPPVVAVQVQARGHRKGIIQKLRERKAGRHASRAGGAFVPGR